MERFGALSRGAQIMLVAGVLLLIDTFLPWQDVGDEIGEFADAIGVDTSVSAWHGFAGWVLGLLTIVLLAWIVVRIMAIDIPLPVSQAMTAALLGVLILFFAVIKNLVDDYSTIWSYIGIVLAAGVAYGAWLQIQEAGGVETLRSEIPTRPAAAPEPPVAAEPPPASPPPAPPPAAPPQPADPTIPPADTPPGDRT
jgi:hypothetical protein